MILATGATGKIGTETVRLLGSKCHPVRALVRETVRAPQDRSWSDVEIAVGDFDQLDTLDAVMHGVDTLLLTTPSVPAQEIAVIDSAARRAVKHVATASSAWSIHVTCPRPLRPTPPAMRGAPTC